MAGRRPGFDPRVGKISWRREQLSTPVFWPGEFHGLCIVHGVTESRTQLSNFFTFTFHCKAGHLIHGQDLQGGARASLLRPSSTSISPLAGHQLAWTLDSQVSLLLCPLQLLQAACPFPGTVITEAPIRECLLSDSFVILFTPSPPQWTMSF